MCLFQDLNKKRIFVSTERAWISPSMSVDDFHRLAKQVCYGATYGAWKGIITWSQLERKVSVVASLLPCVLRHSLYKRLCNVYLVTQVLHDAL